MAGPMDTLSDRMRHLRAAGWSDPISIDEAGVRCLACGRWAIPEDVGIDHVYRFEGVSDPGDQSILFAISLPCGHRGALPAAYGKDATPEVVDVVTRFRLDRGSGPRGVVVVDVGSIDHQGAHGPIWHLPHGGDLDANVVHLRPHDVIGEHVNQEVDVLIHVLEGEAQITVNGAAHPLYAGHLVLVPVGTRRQVTSGASGVTYLTVHRRRSALGITPGRGGPPTPVPGQS
jgi:mannose-6-phosphate isomerase-like protein (cupin superfamily)